MAVKRRTLRATARAAARRVQVLGERAAAASTDSRDEAFLALFRARVAAYEASLRYLRSLARTAHGPGRAEAVEAVEAVRERLADWRETLADAEAYVRAVTPAS